MSGRPQALVDLDMTPEHGVIVVRRVATAARRKKLVRLLAMLLDKPDTPGDGAPNEQSAHR